MWRSVFLHEFLDDRIGIFQALPGRPTPASFLLRPENGPLPATRAVAITPGSGFEHVLDAPLSQIIGASVRARLLYRGGTPTLFSVLRLGAAVELLFWPEADPLPDGSGTRALARVWVGSGFRNLGNVVLPPDRFVDFRFDWHASGQARLIADGRLVAYHNSVAPGALLGFDRVAFGLGAMPDGAPQPVYHLSRVFVRALARPDALAGLSRLLPKVEATPDVNRCRLRIIGNALQVAERLRAFMGGIHASLSQPWNALTGSANGPFRPEAVEAHGRAIEAVAALAAMLKSGDFSGGDSFLTPFGAFLRILRDAQPQAFAALAAEIDAMQLVPEDCQAAFQASDRDRAAFAPLVALLMEGEALVRAIAGGN